MITQLLNIPIPYHYQAGKSVRRIMLNALMSMHFQKRNKLKTMFQSSLTELIKSNIKLMGHTNISTYQVNFTFYADKSTKSCDVDGFAMAGKWAIDVLKLSLGVDDSFKFITAVSYLYGGKAKDEALVMTVMQDDGLSCDNATLVGK